MVARVVTLYGRVECHLCEEAERLLTGLAARLGFELRTVDIDTDPALEREYRWAVPVVCLGEHEVARAPIRAGLLEAALLEAFAAQVRK